MSSLRLKCTDALQLYSYTLRKEEYGLYVDVMNNSSVARERGLIMWFAPDEYLAKVVDRPNLTRNEFTEVVCAWLDAA